MSFWFRRWFLWEIVSQIYLEYPSLAATFFDTSHLGQLLSVGIGCDCFKFSLVCLVSLGILMNGSSGVVVLWGKVKVVAFIALVTVFVYKVVKVSDSLRLPIIPTGCLSFIKGRFCLKISKWNCLRGLQMLLKISRQFFILW